LQRKIHIGGDVEARYKEKHLRVQVKPYIFFSTPGPVDIEVWKKWIVSYLFIGSLYLVSDMQIVHQHMPRLRIPNIVAGLAAAALYIRLLFTVPKEFQLFVVIWNGVTVLSMCLGRIIFSIRAERRKK